jgi:hypothetical protein
LKVNKNFFNKIFKNNELFFYQDTRAIISNFKFTPQDGEASYEFING